MVSPHEGQALLVGLGSFSFPCNSQAQGSPRVRSIRLALSKSGKRTQKAGPSGEQSMGASRKPQWILRHRDLQRVAILEAQSHAGWAFPLQGSQG